ncbi:MAG: hypothetical protein V5A54_06380 [Haloarculaceae archaeon]
MSRSTSGISTEQLPTPICDVCGCEIEEMDQDCVAVDEGVCVP